MNLKDKKICVLMGGRSGERDVSLRSGKRVFESLSRQGFNVITMDLEDDLVFQLKKHKVDVVYNILHGRFGEDGTVQGLLELANIPYTGSKVLASALAMNKLACKRIFNALDIPTPRFAEVDVLSDMRYATRKIREMFPGQIILKPTSEGSSLGVVLINKNDDLAKILESAVANYKDVFVEEYIKGQEVTVGILGVGKNLRALPVLELVPKKEFYDYEAKYTPGMTDFILPANLPKDVYAQVQENAIWAHRALGCYGVSRVDLIVKDGKSYVIEVNSLPGMTEQSDLPAEAKEAGISFDQLVVEILSSAY